MQKPMNTKPLTDDELMDIERKQGRDPRPTPEQTAMAEYQDKLDQGKGE